MRYRLLIRQLQGRLANFCGRSGTTSTTVCQFKDLDPEEVNKEIKVDLTLVSNGMHKALIGST